MIRRFWPRGMVGQLVVAIALALFVAQAVNFALLANGQRQQAIAHGGGMIVARIVDGVERVRKNGGGQGTQIIPMTNQKDREMPHIRGDRDRRVSYDGARRGGADAPSDQPFRLHIADQPFPQPAGAEILTDVGRYVADQVAEAGVSADQVRAWALPESQNATGRNFRGRVIYVTLQVDGRFYTARGRLPPSGDRLPGFLVWQTLTLYLLLLVPIMLIAWRAAAPLRQLTGAARANPMMRDSVPITEAGPSDVRDLIRAFNTYRSRIDTMLTDKDRMLGAVGHDLRTPLASLRVRVEQVEDELLRNKMIASIEEMAAMLTDILALARSGAGTEMPDLVAGDRLMQELAADYREQGEDVSLDQLHPVTVRARPMLLRRALRNLIGNAAAYGVRARLSVIEDQGMAKFIISDDGPGLTDEQIRDLVKPFARGEASRNRATGGSGLGLAIARDIAEGEGGKLDLRTRSEGGLDAMIWLPLADQL